MKAIAENPLLTIEITHTTRNDRYSERTIYTAFKHFSSIEESFIYNFSTDTWTRYRRTPKGVEMEDGKDYSSVLKCYLHTML